ncbi:ankyrin [Trametopsis cervina]|nr:ankyrin [Trametopsis cervina]
MDPASAIIGIVSFGLTVFGKVKEVVDTVKGASDDLQALKDVSADIEVLLLAIQRTDIHLHFTPGPELAYLGRLQTRVEKSLESVDAFAEKVQKLSRNANGESKINKVKWFLKKSEFDDVNQQLKDIETALGLMMAFINSRSQQHVTAVLGQVHDNVSAIRSTEVYRVRRRLGQDRIGSSPRSDSLRCLDGCQCRCHTYAFRTLVPKYLVPYFGQIFLPKRVLHPPWSSWSRCNEQTCRGDWLTEVPLRWFLPTGGLALHLELSSPSLPVYLSVSTPRLVPRNALVWRLVGSGDVEGVRELFLRRQASVYDITEGGGSVITFACRAWQQDPCERNLDMIRFLVEAGADAGFSVATNMSAQDYLVLMSYKYLLTRTGRDFATSVKTCPVSMEIFRSLLDIDILDAMEEYIDRKGSPNVHKLLGLEETDNTQPPSDKFSAFRSLTTFTPLEYATILSPDNVMPLLARGEDASSGAPLCYAVGWGHTDFIKPMLDAGADVNARDNRGMAVLHYVCYYARYQSLQELLRWADQDIDWNARTRNGKNALDLVKESVSFDDLPSSELEGFMSILEGRVNMEEDDDEPCSKIPGAFSTVS